MCDEHSEEHLGRDGGSSSAAIDQFRQAPSGQSPKINAAAHSVAMVYESTRRALN